MEKITLTLTNPQGMHARPASLLTKLVKDFKSEIYFYKNDIDNKKYQPKSILSVMSVGAAQGDKLTFVAEGSDEKEAIGAITTFIQSGCGE
ncbi:HPr family phosphocarrier protein [Cellulosilyticum sp. I15G10I2]|uniref:HPr family phosphocarrier protein n=1 Tax=Cellulosilyticum sp. I15G10I2 TaxID=1892843 RepID=UPI00085C1A2F|nr:HPr family phosphocarrier protein [Cellulosilyticum sp. I15G10I2]